MYGRLDNLKWKVFIYSQVNEEGGVIERVIVKHDSRCVADDFEDQAADHTDEETPCLVVDSQSQLGEDEDAEDDGEGKVASKRCSVCEGRLSETAGVESAQVAGDLKVAVGVWIDGHLGGCRVGDVSCILCCTVIG